MDEDMDRRMFARCPSCGCYSALRHAEGCPQSIDIFTEERKRTFRAQDALYNETMKTS